MSAIVRVRDNKGVVHDIPAIVGPKGDTGATGPQGAPGSDASVTPENIQAALGYKPIRDVQVAGNSVLDGGVAKVPIATNQTNGVSRPDFYGIGVSPAGILYVQNTTNANITKRISSAPLTAYNLDYAVKAAMCDGKGAAWTEAEKKAARERMGIDKAYELIEEIDITEDGITNIEREVNVTNIYVLLVCPSGNTGTQNIKIITDTGVPITAYWNVANNLYAQFEANVVHGIVDVFYKFSNNQSSTPSTFGLNFASMRNSLKAINKHKYIKSFSIMGGEIPNGSKIEIFGVRA